MPFIYGCFDKETDDIIYIGSSLLKYLSLRVCNHRFKYHNKPTPFHKYLKEQKGWDNYIFKVVEEFPNITKNDLLFKEREYIELLNPVGNRQIPLRTREEELQKSKERYYKNKEDWNMLRKQRVECVYCNKEYSRSSLSSHIKNLHTDVDVACTQIF